MKSQLYAFALIASFHGAVRIQADVIKYTNKAQWTSLVDAYTTVTFTELPAPGVVTDQYSYLGITFTEGDDVTEFNNGFINNGMGLYGNWFYPNDTISIVFSQPITSFGIDHPGPEGMKLYLKGELIFSTGVMGFGGTGNFSGVISTIAFDKVVIDDPTVGVTAIDDLHFGPPIPAPGALGVVGLAVVLGIRRRRRA